MPRNPQGLYTLPLPPVRAGEVIESAWANTTIDDIATAMTGSLPRNGSAPMLAPLTLSNTPPTQPRHAVDVGYVQQFLAYATGMPVGAVIPLAGASIPNGFLLCDGRAVSRTDYAVLFAAIGTIYGAGDGATTFNVPDMRDWFVRGKGDTRQVGSTQTAAFAAHVHGVSDPGHHHGQAAHNHSVTTGDHSHGVNDPGHSHSQGFEVNAGQYGVSAAILNTPWVHQTGTSGTGISIQSAGNLGGSTDSKQPEVYGNTTGVSIGAAGGDETRPQNVAMNYVIKAVNDSVASAAITGITSSDGNCISINNANPAVPELVIHSNVPFGAAKLGSDGKIPLSIMPPMDSQFLGFYDASTNTLPGGVFSSGDTYTISVAGTLNVYDPVTLTASPTLVSVGGNIVYITGSLSNPTGWYYAVATNNDVVTDTLVLGLSSTRSENHFWDGSVPNQLSLKRGTPDAPGAELIKALNGALSFPSQGQLLTGSNGYVALPGGLIIQWGNDFTDAGSNFGDTFAFQFPNGPLSVVAMSSTPNAVPSLTTIDNNGLVLTVRLGSTGAGVGPGVQVFYIALGH